MKLSRCRSASGLVSACALLVLGGGGCGGEPSAMSGDEADLTSTSRFATLEALTAIAVPTDGILPAGEEQRREAQSGGSMAQGLWSGADDDGRPCSVHVIHYTYRDSREVYLQAWRDDEAVIRRYDEDFDRNVSGVERGIARTKRGPHTLSFSDRAGDDVKSFASAAGFAKITLRDVLVKNAKEERHDVETEVRDLAKPGASVVVRIKKLGSDDVVACRDLVPRATVER